MDAMPDFRWLDSIVDSIPRPAVCHTLWLLPLKLDFAGNAYRKRPSQIPKPSKEIGNRIRNCSMGTTMKKSRNPMSMPKAIVTIHALYYYQQIINNFQRKKKSILRQVDPCGPNKRHGFCASILRREWLICPYSQFYRLRT